MKNILVLFILVVLSGCGRNYKLQIKNDPFLNCKIYSLPMWHKVTEGVYDNWETVYKKNLTNGSFSQITVMFKFRYVINPNAGVVVEKFKDKVHIMIEKKIYTVDVHDIKQQVIEQHISRVNKPSNGENASGKTKINVKNSNIMNSTINNSTYVTNLSSIYFNVHVKIGLTNEIVEKISNMDLRNDLMYRFYTGDDVVTLKATKGQLNALKKFIKKKA